MEDYHAAAVEPATIPLEPNPRKIGIQEIINTITVKQAKTSRFLHDAAPFFYSIIYF